MPIILILLIIGMIIGIIGTLIVWMKKKKGTYKEPNYRIFFILGICLLPMGFIVMVTADNPGFIGISGLGIIYITIGLSNIKKWKEN
jgi:hypothetical protein